MKHAVIANIEISLLRRNMIKKVKGSGTDKSLIKFDLWQDPDKCQPDNQGFQQLKRGAKVKGRMVAVQLPGSSVFIDHVAVMKLLLLQ